jgi:hypothetical protein
VIDDAAWRERTSELAARFGLAEPHRDYVGFEARCWKCGEPSPVFRWPGIKDWVLPPEPAPRTVKSRFSKTIGETYPADGWIHCDAIVGDFYLLELLLNYVDYEEAGQLADRFLNDLQKGTDAT